MLLVPTVTCSALARVLSMHHNTTGCARHPAVLHHSINGHQGLVVCCFFQGEPVLLEPLPALLSCVHRLATEHAAATSGDWNTGTADNSSGALQVQ